MFDPQRLLGQVLSGAFGGAGRKVASIDRGLSQMGGMGGFGGGAKVAAGLGLLGVAMAAYEHWREPSAAPGAAASMPAQSALPPPPPPAEFPVVSAPRPTVLPVTRELPAVGSGAGEEIPFSPAMHLLRSMIAAAHADGVLDSAERATLLQRAREAQLPAEDLVVLGGELNQPRSLDQLLADTPPDLVLETYAAALLAIRVDHVAERQYLDALAAGLRLSPDQRAQVHQQVAGM